MPFLPSILSTLGPEIGKALPYLTLGLFGGGGGDDRNNFAPGTEQLNLASAEQATQNAELLKIRQQLARQMFGRQQQLQPLFEATSQGVFGLLPRYATRGKHVDSIIPDRPDLRGE